MGEVASSPLQWNVKMHRTLSVFVFVATTQVLTAQSPAINPEMSALFQGNFSCKGSFASGKPIEADVSFTPQLDGRWLAYSHADRAPNRYKALGYWGPDGESKKFVMLLVDVGGARMFSSDGWNAGAITFERMPLPGQLGRKERFRFEKELDVSFKMTYETANGSDWKLGDSIVCTRTASANAPVD